MYDKSIKDYEPATDDEVVKWLLEQDKKNLTENVKKPIRVIHDLRGELLEEREIDIT